MESKFSSWSQVICVRYAVDYGNFDQYKLYDQLAPPTHLAFQILSILALIEVLRLTVSKHCHPKSNASSQYELVVGGIVRVLVEGQRFEKIQKLAGGPTPKCEKGEHVPVCVSISRSLKPCLGWHLLKDVNFAYHSWEFERIGKCEQLYESVAGLWYQLAQAFLGRFYWGGFPGLDCLPPTVCVVVIVLCQCNEAIHRFC